MTDAITLGIEQEYFLVDPESGEIRCHRGDDDIKYLSDRLGDRFAQEFHACMVETRTPIATSVSEAIQMARADRQDMAAALQGLGLSLYPAGTHPQGFWQRQERSPSQRYAKIVREIGISARKALYSGLHVHIGIANNEERIRVLRELVPYLPIFLGLSSSSPFWEGELTGYQSFRTRAQGEFPRSGPPPSFHSWKDYELYIAGLKASEIEEPATKVWWDARPSGKYPTLEVRITDMLPDIRDVAAVVSLIACVVRVLSAESSLLKSLDGMPIHLAEQNRWLAQRDGVAASLLDNSFTRHPFKHYLTGIIEAIRPTAVELGCVDELEYCLKIADGNTSAYRQIHEFDQVIGRGASEAEALAAVSRSVLKQAYSY